QAGRPYSTATPRTGPRDSRMRGEKETPENPRLAAVVKQDAEDGAFSSSIVRGRGPKKARKSRRALRKRGGARGGQNEGDYGCPKERAMNRREGIRLARWRVLRILAAGLALLGMAGRGLAQNDPVHVWVGKLDAANLEKWAGGHLGQEQKYVDELLAVKGA